MVVVGRALCPWRTLYLALDDPPEGDADPEAVRRHQQHAHLGEPPLHEACRAPEPVTKGVAPVAPLRTIPVQHLHQPTRPEARISEQCL